MGGLWAQAPRMGAAALVLCMALVGLPGLVNFVSEFLVLVGTWTVSPVATVIAGLGLVIATVYSLRLFQTAFHGAPREKWVIKDLSARETGTLFLAIALLVLLRAVPGARPRHGGALGERRARSPGSGGWRMNAQDFVGILSLVILAAASLMVLFAAAFTRKMLVSFVITLVGLAAAIVAAALAGRQAPFVVAGILSFDRFVLFGIILILGGTFFAAVSSWAALRGRAEEGGDYFFLFLLSALGACILAASSAFASFFLGLELMSVSLYALIGWRRESGIGTEAAIKYLVIAGASSAFLLFGMALFYAETGTMDLARLASAGTAQGLLAPVGLGMILVGIGFKLAVVPFHLWTPDIYDGAPAPVTGFIATVSKGAMVVVLARAFAPALVGTGGVNGLLRESAGAVSAAFPWVFAMIAALSMFAGNILALRESNVKRVLAYSSIAHLGYILVAFLAGGTEALRAIAFYLVAYFATTLGAFAAIAELSTPEADADGIDDYRGLAARRPWLAAALTAMLLSLAGLPLDRGIRRKVRHPAGGCRCRAVDPCGDPCRQRDDLHLLLPEDRVGDVPRLCRASRAGGRSGRWRGGKRGGRRRGKHSGPARAVRGRGGAGGAHSRRGCPRRVSFAAAFRSSAR